MGKINKTKYALLGVLNLKSGSGYDIKKFCDNSIGFFWNENYGHIYPVLKKLEEEELVTKEVVLAKNMYSITEKGRNALYEWLKEPVEIVPARSELLLKIFMAGDIEVTYIIDDIKERQEILKKELEKMLKIEENLNLENEKANKKNIILWKITLKSGIKNIEAQIQWSKEALELLDEIK